MCDNIHLNAHLLTITAAAAISLRLSAQICSIDPDIYHKIPIIVIGNSGRDSLGRREAAQTL